MQRPEVFIPKAELVVPSGIDLFDMIEVINSAGCSLFEHQEFLDNIMAINNFLHVPLIETYDDESAHTLHLGHLDPGRSLVKTSLSIEDGPYTKDGIRMPSDRSALILAGIFSERCEEIMVIWGVTSAGLLVNGVTTGAVDMDIINVDPGNVLADYYRGLYARESPLEQ